MAAQLIFSFSIANAQSGFSIGFGIEPGLSYNTNSTYLGGSAKFIRYTAFLDYQLSPKWTIESGIKTYKISYPVGTRLYRDHAGVGTQELQYFEIPLLIHFFPQASPSQERIGGPLWNSPAGPYAQFYFEGGALIGVLRSAHWKGIQDSSAFAGYHPPLPQTEDNESDFRKSYIKVAIGYGWLLGRGRFKVLIGQQFSSTFQNQNQNGDVQGWDERISLTDFCLRLGAQLGL